MKQKLKTGDERSGVMADITMCQNEECPIKEKCYRQTATPNEHRQGYARWEPEECADEGGYICTGYWPKRIMAKGECDV